MALYICFMIVSTFLPYDGAMKKLKLDVDSLTVISFASSVVRNRGGTVHAQSTFETTFSGMTVCNSEVSDCADTANRSCHGTCEVLTETCM